MSNGCHTLTILVRIITLLTMPIRDDSDFKYDQVYFETNTILFIITIVMILNIYLFRI